MSAPSDGDVRRFLLTREQRRIVKFAIVGASGLVVNQAIVWFVGAMLLGGTDSGMGRATALGAGIVVSIFTNFVMNDLWTWGDRQKGGTADWFRRCAVFYGTNGVGAAIQWSVAATVAHMLVLERSVGGVDGRALSLQLASLTGVAVATPLNYVVNHYLTFRDRSK
ncbi:MAG: GtrA family protein [Myxococcales bacterium]|nr:GtrA family protein [Myxococcales bacterium]MCB9532389.1 GtrA family protein [Myxococcales bacterium]